MRKKRTGLQERALLSFNAKATGSQYEYCQATLMDDSILL
jgi:hypothetical protein